MPASHRLQLTRIRPATQQGFTLIELLVVLLIIGIVLSFVSLSLDPTGTAERLDREAHRLDALTHTAATDALLHGVEIGLDITPKGYRFVRLKKEGWQVLGGDIPLHPRKLGEGLELVAITSHKGKRPKLVSPQQDDDQGDDNSDIRRRPEAIFLSSGEIIPFTLELHAKHLDQHYRLIGHADGRIELKQIGGSN